ncbi:unnamed protein product [Phytomonas sp. EM1]|nr:unnamed protein product [Phytomonas sp. EM1]|eukprot:CCW65517.1 unnamed protein product [Phytomonas sp. isolate EM1]
MTFSYFIFSLLRSLESTFDMLCAEFSFAMRTSKLRQKIQMQSSAFSKQSSEIWAGSTRATSLRSLYQASAMDFTFPVKKENMASGGKRGQVEVAKASRNGEFQCERSLLG